MATSTSVLALTRATFDEEVLGSDLPVVVDVWATWCPPCKALAPILDELAVALEGRVRFAAVDADAEPELAARFSVLSFPTLLVFREGRLVHRMIGARGRGHLLEELGRVVPL
jgi:thioredoxin